MNLIDAIKSGRPWRRVGDRGDWNRAHTDDCTRYSISTDGLFADYEIQEPTVTITRAQFLKAARAAHREDPNAFVFALLCKLGLEPAA